MKFIRNSHGMTQKTLGILVVFLRRMTMSVWHNMNKEFIYTLAKALEVAPQSLTAPDIDGFGAHIVCSRRYLRLDR